MILRFVADDSSQVAPPIYVLAGYLASVDTWNKFSTDWSEELQRSPPLRRLKTNTIRHDLKTNVAANEKLDSLYQVVEKHIRYAAAVAIDSNIIKSSFEKNDKISSHPFYSMASILVTDVAMLMAERNIAFTGIEFVFDDQMREKSAS